MNTIMNIISRRFITPVRLNPRRKYTSINQSDDSDDFMIFITLSSIAVFINNKHRKQRENNNIKKSIMYN